MSKRKRKKQKSNNRNAKRDRDSDQGNAHGAASPVVATPKSQRALLWLSLGLLAAVIGINAWRYKPKTLAAPIPFPAKPLVALPLAEASPPGGDTRFTKLPATQTGITFAHPVVVDHPMAHLYFSSPASGGTAVGDVNNDGRPDIFIASGPDKNKLYVQTETDFQFTDVTDVAGVDGGDSWSCGATMVDINADGRLDIFVANYDSPNQLFINQGDGSFTNQAAEYRLNMTDASLEGAFADYDRDGDLDLYLLTYRYENPDGMPASAPVVMKDGKRAIHPDFEKYYAITNDKIGFSTVGRWDNLLRNNGDGTFSNVTLDAGIYGPGHGQSVTWWDFDQDGHVDIHVGNDFNDPDRLYRNNGDGTFTDVVRERMPHITWFSMGADVGDINGDGLPDLLSADMSSTTHFKQKTTMGSMGSNAEFLATAVPRQYMRNALLLNSRSGRFREAAYLTGLESTDWTWSVKIADFDCDGRLDAFFTNGSVRSFTDSDLVLSLSQRRGKTEWDIYKNTEPLRESNLVFQNQGQLSFLDRSKAWGLDHLGVSMSSAQGDFDGDGDLDLVVANMDEPVSIYRNDTVDHNRITLRLHGLEQNRFATGATVRMSHSGLEQTAELQPTRGFLSSNQPLVHFGCGDAANVDVSIAWADGTYQELKSLATNRHYEVTQQRDLPPTPVRPPTSQWFEEKQIPAELAHEENDFDDYALQPLLPHRMSSLGPAIALGDANGDGRMDLFLGGAMGKAGQVAIWSDEENNYSVTTQTSLFADKQYEDMGAVWLDVDADGDADLFVSSGGNEHPDGSPLYQPRLYLNDGTGVLTRSNEWLPNLSISAGPVAAADFDKDGDTDLFLGGRQVPGKYPLPANSYLLVNTGSKFVNAGKTHFKNQLSELGMVTGAVWTDVDQDEDLDLFVTLEWDSIRLYRNQDGQFVDESSQSGLRAYRGWWTGITPADLDHDGDIDYVATNLGRNTKYHATDEKPFWIYYGDFEGNGVRKLVEAEYEADKLFPVRGKSCSTHAMPTLGSKFTTYKQFATATLQEIYTTECLEEAYQCSANFLDNAILLNDGAGNFQVVSLPAEAQLAPGFGCTTGDFNDDGHTDIFIAQNFFSPQPETGNMDGGLSCLLKGVGDGSFKALSPGESGVVVPQDAMAAVQNFVADGTHILVATNNDQLQLWNNKRRSTGLVIRFANVHCSSQIAGARINVQFDDKTSQTVEIASGSGYLSQQSPSVCVANPSQVPGTVNVNSGGFVTSQRFVAGQNDVLLNLSEDRSQTSR